MNAKDKKLEVCSYFQKAKGEFLAGSYSVSSNKGLSNASLAFVLMRMCAR